MFLPRHHKVVIITHSSRGLNDLAFIVANHFNALEVHSQFEAELREICRVRIHGLGRTFSAESLLCCKFITRAHLAAEDFVANDYASCGVYHTPALFLC